MIMKSGDMIRRICRPLVRLIPLLRRFAEGVHTRLHIRERARWHSSSSSISEMREAVQWLRFDRQSGIRSMALSSAGKVGRRLNALPPLGLHGNCQRRRSQCRSLNSRLFAHRYYVANPAAQRRLRSLMVVPITNLPIRLPGFCE
jgi:hypothetical protein